MYKVRAMWCYVSSAWVGCKELSVMEVLTKRSWNIKNQDSF